MKVLVLGSGAREHGLVRALASDPDVQAHAAPGNPGMQPDAACHPLDPADPAAVVGLAHELGVDLVVVGPEGPLVAGVADALAAAQPPVPCFGPSAAAARLEGSKAFAKQVMAAADVPTAFAHVCDTLAQVEAAMEATGAPYVVKADGLAAGKGVVVTGDAAEALAHAERCLAAEGSQVVVEEHLDGPEVSVFVLSDGRTVVPLEPAQDFKRAHDGGAGPNTGGMGAYSPLPWVPAGLLDEVRERVAEPVIREMARLGAPFVGVLYVGLALTARGPRVIEFNARFGDPDSQVVLARLREPLAEVLLACAQGRLDELGPLRFSPDAAVCVVLAAQGYPGTPATGGAITGLGADGQLAGPPDEHTYLLHAGTRRDAASPGSADAGSGAAAGAFAAAGGRVIDVIGLGADLVQARERAYAGLARLHLEGGHHRSDIALAAARGEVVIPTSTSGDPL